MRRFSLSTVAVLSFAAMFCMPGFAAAEPLTLRLGHTGYPGIAFTYGYEKFKEILERNSGGGIRVHLYPNGVLGSDRVLTESCQLGCLEIAMCGSSNLGNFIPTAAAFDLPFLLNPDKHDQYLAAFGDGPIAAYLDKKAAEVGLKLIMSMDSAYRGYATARKPLDDVESLKGVKMRTTASAVDMATAEALGMNPTPIAYSDVFTALQQGTVDGELLGYDALHNSGRWEVDKFFLQTDHNHPVIFAFMNRKFWDGLSKEEQRLILEAAREAERLEYAYNRDVVRRGEEFVRGKNVTIHKLSPEERERMKRMTASIYDRFDSIDPELLRLIRETQK